MAVSTMLISLFCFGNPSRGDDAIGEVMGDWCGHLIDEQDSTTLPHSIRLVRDFQLEPEHIFDLDGSDVGIFVDCHLSAQAPFSWGSIQPGTQLTFSSHNITPESLLFLYESTLGTPAPPCFLLGIRGYAFELGSGISDIGQENLQCAQEFLAIKLKNPLGN